MLWYMHNILHVENMRSAFLIFKKEPQGKKQLCLTESKSHRCQMVPNDQQPV